MPANIVHIGYPKTATTFLQWNIFPNLKGLHYIDYHTCRQIFQPIVYADPLDYSIEDLKLKSSDTENQLYSFESLAGSPFYYKGLGRSNIPFTLKAMGFGKVIITIRNQTKAIDSYYRQYVVQGGTLSFRNWLDFENQRPLPQKYFNRNYLQFDKLIDKYMEVFGKENVLLLTQESLKADQSQFINQIEDFTNSSFQSTSHPKKANESLSNASIWLLRLVNHFTFSSMRPFHLISKRISNRPIWKIFAVILDPYLISLFSNRKSYVEKFELRERVEEYYHESNQNLKDKWGIDLIHKT